MNITIRKKQKKDIPDPLGVAVAGAVVGASIGVAGAVAVHNRKRLKKVKDQAVGLVGNVLKQGKKETKRMKTSAKISSANMKNAATTLPAGQL